MGLNQRSGLGFLAAVVIGSLGGLIGLGGAGFGLPLLGVAGGELLIPTIVLIYALDIKLAGVCRWRSACRPCWWALPATAR